MPHRTATALLAMALAIPALAACGSDDPGATPGEPQNLTVWLMKDTATDEYVADFEAAFERDHPEYTLTVQIQEWDGITEKVTGALASTDPPDVIEVGNTQVAQYAASGGVTDLSDKVGELGGEDWLPGLAEPGAVDDRQYGIPFYAANRVVIYRTDLFEAKGIQPPTTRAEWLTATAALNQGGTQGIYLPGQNWYVLAGFVWDEGGDLAVRDGDRWAGALNTPEALAGADFYRQLQALGKGPRDSDEAKPQQTDVFARGDVAQLIAVPGAAKLVTTANPELDGKLGFFPIPGKTADEPGAVFTGGSDLIVPMASPRQDGAYAVVKELAGERWQTELARTMNYVPNRTSLAAAVEDDPGAAAMAEGAANGHATPNSPNWTAVEARNPIKEFLTKVLTGTDPKAAAADADAVITAALNTAQ
ncbi:extracellular solute-binding protein [Actinophytocola algeriensis]|uniref:N,N'-diacetylchitobiose transport system substrate-binding protein n=1 Tax=Actinophytocola algeriensis TaxID=1768010 RepID=A0A7W7VIX4_9PSEU|nr:extracellular solute-binding protein [Actinophytocola algeriensis]MBB4911744.1 N,N'-diacetylchitobiose transport system substrate-binding protein [Actinophytocola algeriensis]MBE1473268.1 N,N'-diacetylchitobiose transport system substrate-binding protein [Actinophytocola algeriensis]